MTNVQRYLEKSIFEQTARTMKLWQKKPIIFIEDVMGVNLDEWQKDCVELYMNHQRLALVASKGPGKTGLLAFLGWHFFLTNYRPKMAALSISKDHLKSNLWAELHMWRAQSPVIMKSTNDGASRITLVGHESYSFIDARAYPKSADQKEQASALAGLHANNVAFLIDEAGTIPDAVLNTADAALSTGDSDTKKAKLLVTANPEQPEGVIYRAAEGRSIQDWAVYKVSGDPLDPKRAPRVSIKWAQEQIDTYGRDHPWVMVNVLAQYPPTSSTKLISESEVTASMRREIDDREVSNFQTRLGVDVARGGIDSTALARRKGQKAYPIELVSSAAKGPELAGKISFLADEYRIERVFVDDTGGYGSSVIDNLEFVPHVDVTPVVYNKKAQDPRHYNCRTEMWVRMRDWIRQGGKIPNDPMLAEEILMPNIYFLKGVLRLEEKEQIKQRLGRSPDRADALAQTFMDKDQPSYYAAQDPGGGSVGHPHQNQGGYTSDPSQLNQYNGPPSNYHS